MKCQSNSEIAGSPRNAFRCSLGNNVTGGRALDRLGGINCLPNRTKLSNAGNQYPGVRPWVLRFMAERETTQTAG